MTYPASTGQTPRFEIFPWSHHFNTGIEVIDAQHRQLVFLLNQMAEYVIEGASEAELKALIDELADYAQYHFSTEEAIWAQAFAQESSFADHCHIHQEFSRKVLALQAEQASLHCALDDIFGFLTHWLAFHILDSDKRMALTLKAVESGESLPRAKQLAEEEMSGTLSALIDAVLSMYRNLSERTLDLMREKKARGQAEDALRDLESQVLERSQHRYEVLFNSIPDAVFVADILTGQLIGANTQAEAIIGLKLQEIQQLHFTDLHPDSAKAENERHFSELLKHPGEIRVFETQLLHSSGRCIEVEIHAGGRYREGEASAMVALMRDITQRREQAAEKDAALQRLQEAERIAGVGHWHYDWQKDQLQASDEVFRLLESSVETFAGNFQAFVNSIHPEDQNAFTQVFADSLTQSDLIGECEHRVQNATGAVRYVKERFEHQANAAGAVLFTTGTIQDITSSALYQQKLEYLAFHDSLTALYNRVGISRYLDQRLQAAPQTPLAVVYLDLDNFSEVNNRLGDLCGDELLREVALRLRCFVQDQEGLARPGGDEFVLILERAQEDEHFIQRLEQLLDHLREPYELQGQPHLSQVSAGISFYPQTLKIDRAFVQDMLDDPDDLAILEGVVGLANAFRRNVLAEGVETLEQGEMLIQLGCEWAQGYAIAKPMPADQVLPWWEQWLPDASWRRLQPVRRDKLAVLFAIVEHRAWIRRLQVVLKQQADWPPMDPTRCRFGQWLAKQSGTTPEEVELLKTLQHQHLNIHQFAAELKAQPQRYAAEEASLYAYRDQLVETLKLYLMNSST